MSYKNIFLIKKILAKRQSRNKINIQNKVHFKKHFTGVKMYLGFVKDTLLNLLNFYYD